VWAAVGTAEGYQFWTHAEITRRAFEQSAEIETYLHSIGIQAADRFVRFARTPPPSLARFNNDGTPRDWMIEGVIREDDYSAHPEVEVFFGCPPPENPFSPIDRVFNHFLDVQRGGRGLTVLLQTLGLPASEWALGKPGEAPAGNKFSLVDARQYQFQSLTASSASERELNTALFFRALGHVIHLLQDVAQPQHTRNDRHSGCVPPIGGHSSWYERYVETRALRQNFRSRGTTSPELILDGYPAPKLTTYEAYWSSSQQEGLGDLSSRNFFSAGTNLGELVPCGGLAAPPCRVDAYRPEDRRFEFRAARGRPIAGTVRVFVHEFADPIRQRVYQAAVTSRSIWDEHLERVNRGPAFTLNTLNYDSAADLLIPRAVGYTVGLLDRFFRARIGAGVDEDQRIVFQNFSADEMAQGFFFVLHENPEGVREPLASFVLALPPEGQSAPLTVPKLPPNPPPGTRCWVVFQGTLGDEKDVVAGSLTGCPVEPTPPPHLGNVWYSYQCRLIPFSNRPGGAPPDEWIYYTYATQSPPRNIDGFAVHQFSRFKPNGTTDCALGSSGPVPEGTVFPPEVRLELL
jgi:hypothetical protein